MLALVIVVTDRMMLCQPTSTSTHPVTVADRSTACFFIFLTMVLCLTNLNAKNSLKAVPIIFDPDIGNGVDDLLALGMIHDLETRDECK